jgi:hypothetical protein
MELKVIKGPRDQLGNPWKKRGATPPDMLGAHPLMPVADWTGIARGDASGSKT